ncbi:hypothetical protein [Saccharopolyspora shandongensis]|uniref:hypothetical protein n=1 Tax=Saccharopolyspora shandongensis TaxID=418495 RepID=UPI0033CA14BF
MFLIDIREARGKDTDVLLAHLVRRWPDHASLLVRRLWKAGMPIGPQATTTLATVTDDADLELDEQWTAVMTLLDLGHPEGIARLLGMAADMDLPDSDRIRALRTASRLSPAAAAAANFLVRRHDFPDWDFLTSTIDANDALLDIAGFAVLDGLALVTRSRRLTDGTRLHAAAAAPIKDQSMYRLVAQDRFHDLGEAIGDEINNGTSEVSSLLWFMVTQGAASASDRWVRCNQWPLRCELYPPLRADRENTTSQVSASSFKTVEVRSPRFSSRRCSPLAPHNSHLRGGDSSVD